jgi:two-component sensor histidine kinase
MPIRVRLALALVLALAPVLIISAVQSIIAARRDATEHRVELASAAERTAATAHGKIAAAEVLLQTLSTGSLGAQCAPRLVEIRKSIPGYDNLIQFDAGGGVACSAVGVPADPDRRSRPWFAALASGQPVTQTSQAGAAYASHPAVLVSARTLDQAGRFNGALTAVMDVASLKPQMLERLLPDRSQVAITDQRGRFLSASVGGAFPSDVGEHLVGPGDQATLVWQGVDRAGQARVFSSAPLVDKEVYVVLSTPTQGVLSWAVANPLSGFVLPALAFFLPLLAVGFVAERGVVRWIAYLTRFAAIYARGRYSVHPTRAVTAPPEIRQLAETMDAMAQTIAARDAAVRQVLVQKDDLLREIHHRVKNNLQVISSLLNLQERALDDPAARAVMSDTRQRISALALIYRALYQGPDLRRVELRDFLDELIAQTVMSESVRGAPIRTELDIEPLEIDADRLAPLALFAVEAITNAKKHGLDQDGGVLDVTFHVRGEMAELCISDTGVPGSGPAKVGEGVGRTLMTAFARQLRGEVQFRAKEGGGLTTRLTFPTPSVRAG